MSVLSLPASALASSRFIRFEYVYTQDVLEHHDGAVQFTTYPNRKWVAQLEVNPQFDADLRAWALVLDRLTDRNNVIALGPPYYSGPSTGYSGSSPLVNGASQLGTSLAIDGLSNSSAIQWAGDFLSFDVTTSLSNTNRQLIKVQANYSSNGSGEATVTLVTPIRLAPANNAAVNITTPTAFFMLVTPRSVVDYQLGKFSTFTLDFVERILK